MAGHSIKIFILILPLWWLCLPNLKVSFISLDFTSTLVTTILIDLLLCWKCHLCHDIITVMCFQILSAVITGHDIKFCWCIDNIDHDGSFLIGSLQVSSILRNPLHNGILWFLTMQGLHHINLCTFMNVGLSQLNCWPFLHRSTALKITCTRISSLHHRFHVMASHLLGFGYWFLYMALTVQSAPEFHAFHFPAILEVKLRMLLIVFSLALVSASYSFHYLLSV